MARLDPKQANHLYRIQQTRLTKLKADVIEGKYIVRDAFEQSLKLLADTFVQSLQDLESSLPPLVADRSPPEVATVLAREFDHARQTLVRQADHEVKTHAPKKTAANAKSQAKKRRPGRQSKSRVK